MTASTDAEREEFEKYMLLENYFSERDLVWDGVDGYDCTDADDAFGIWLIARRAQVVPQGWLFVPKVADEKMQRAIAAQFNGTAREALDAWLHKFKPRWRKAA